MQAATPECLIWAETWASGPTARGRIFTATLPEERASLYFCLSNLITIWNWESPARRVNGTTRGTTFTRRVYSTRPCIWVLLLRSEEHTSELQLPCNLVCR